MPTGPHVGEGAAERLADQLGALRALGCTAAGEVVPARPVAAVRHALRGATYDQIILSTLPAGVSAWVRMDAGARIERLSRLPVTHIVAGDAPPDGGGPDGRGGPGMPPGDPAPGPADGIRSRGDDLGSGPC